MEGQLLFRERGTSGAWRSGLRKALRVEDTGHLRKLYVKTLFTFIPVFVAFFVLLGIALSCIRKMLSSVTSEKREFTLAIVSLSTSREVGIVH